MIISIYSYLALLTAIFMAAGQVLFKIGSTHLSVGSFTELFISFIKNIYLLSAIFLYAATILLWIYVLKYLPLSKAYPLTALSYVLVPIISLLILNEPYTLRTFLGCLLILAGVVVAHSQK
jgi:drug/metabolite transporter (DMT)-like permease